jgi:hypothetical protein
MSEPVAATEEERIVLTPEERARFVAFLRQDAAQEFRLMEFLDKMPPGTNGSRIKTDCKIRGNVKSALADELEGKSVG